MSAIIRERTANIQQVHAGASLADVKPGRQSSTRRAWSTSCPSRSGRGLCLCLHPLQSKTMRLPLRHRQQCGDVPSAGGHKQVAADIGEAAAQV